MGSQCGASAVKLLTVLTAIAIVGAVASPWLLRSKRTEAEAKVIGRLREIRTAQQVHFGAGMMYGTMAKLRDSKLLEGPYQDKQFGIEGYQYFHSIDGTRKRFCAEAVPEEKQLGKSFGIDESGVVYEFERNVSPCFAGVLTKTGGEPVR